MFRGKIEHITYDIFIHSTRYYSCSLFRKDQSEIQSYLTQFIKLKSTYSRQANLFGGPEEDLWSGAGRAGCYQLFRHRQPRPGNALTTSAQQTADRLAVCTAQSK